MAADTKTPLYAVKRELDRFIVRYDREKLLVFSLALSYKLKRPSNVILTGPSSAGKSYLLNNIMPYFPISSNPIEAQKKNCGLMLTGISAKALNRFQPPGQTWDHKLLCVQELDGASEAGPVLRTFMSEGISTTLVTEKNKEGGNYAKLWEVKGTPAFFVTTANDNIEQQFANRCNIVEISGDWVPDVLHFEAYKYMDADLTDAQRDEKITQLVETCPQEDHVIVPYADKIAQFWYTDTVVAQRSFPEFLKLIQCIALFHHKQRERYKGTLAANLDDYEIARRIVRISKFKLGAGLLRAYKKIVAALLSDDKQYNHPLVDGQEVRAVTREQLSNLVQRSMPQIDRYIEQLCDIGIFRTHLRWAPEDKNRLREGRNPNVYSLALKTEEDISFPGCRTLLGEHTADLKKSYFEYKDGKWRLSGKSGIPCSVHAYNPLDGEAIDVNADDVVFHSDHAKKTKQLELKPNAD